MSVFNAYMTLSGALDADVMLDERLSHRTSYRIGGPAALYVIAHSLNALVQALDVLGREGVPWVVLGRGSNVLASDTGYRGCVIRLGREFGGTSFVEDGEGNPTGMVVSGAGVLLSKLVGDAQRHGLSGLEPCVGIPGTVGGAVSMDAGTRREWIGSVVSSVVTLRPGHGLIRYEGSEIEWGYRYCSIAAGEIILEVELNLTPSTPEVVAMAVRERDEFRRRRQPMGHPTCGSVFRNPPDGSAGELVDRCGLKGYTVGRAQVSETHANFVVNLGGATSADVLAVIHHMHDEVLKVTGIDLVPEVKFLGFS